MRLSAVTSTLLPGLMFATIAALGQNPCTIDPSGGYGGGIYRVGGNVEAPIPLFTPDPEYLDKPRAAGLQDKARLWVVLDCTGTPADVRIYAPPVTGSVDLGKKAREAVRLWRFQPAMLRGQPVIVQFDVEFTLKVSELGTSTSSAGRGSVTHSLIYTRVPPSTDR